jgi:hypothetical protein
MGSLRARIAALPKKYSMESAKEAVARPILWVLLNQLILTSLGETFEFITLVSIDKSKTSTIPRDSFVDDTTMGVTSNDTNMEPVPIEKTELTADERTL